MFSDSSIYNEKRPTFSFFQQSAVRSHKRSRNNQLKEAREFNLANDDENTKQIESNEEMNSNVEETKKVFHDDFMDYVRSLYRRIVEEKPHL